MTTCTITEQSGIPWLTINGRFDSLTSPEVQRCIDEFILGGRRLIVVNMEQANFVSSAGLRVFLMAQKQLRKVGGEIILYKILDVVMPVFKVSGFDQIFRICSTRQELAAACAVSPDASELTAATDDGITFRRQDLAETTMGVLCIIGSQDKLSTAGYTQDDVITVSQKELQFGAGLATVGEQFDEYKRFFGEALMINNNFYFYPAVRRSAVDYMFYSVRDVGAECRFLHGFGFNGQYRYVAAFETVKDFVTLNRIVQYALSLPSSASLIGIVLLAESKGLYGMNLKQVPLQENKPAHGNDIFDAAHFSSWINFPVDPADENHIVAAAGIICRNRESCAVSVQKLFSSESNAHIHGGIFEKGPISKNINHFSSELDRVMTELVITKVQHLLGQSMFSNGMLGIVELKG